jgi:hypothetical protein
VALAVQGLHLPSQAQALPMAGAVVVEHTQDLLLELVVLAAVAMVELELAQVQMELQILVVVLAAVEVHLVVLEMVATAAQA